MEIDEFEQFDLLAEQDSFYSQAIVVWLVSHIGTAASSTSKLLVDPLVNISAHKDPERQSFLDRALRKAHAIQGGMPIEAAKLGIRYPGISPETFAAYADEGTTRTLVNALAADESLTAQQVITLNRRASMAQSLSFEVIHTPLPEVISKMQQALNALDIGHQLIANQECRQLISPCIFNAVVRKVPLLTEATHKLVGDIKHQNNQFIAQAQDKSLQEEKNNGDL